VNATDGYDVFARRYLANGTPGGDIVRINTSTLDDQLYTGRKRLERPASAILGVSAPPQEDIAMGFACVSILLPTSSVDLATRCAFPRPGRLLLGGKRPWRYLPQIAAVTRSAVVIAAHEKGTSLNGT
jgi:hypothetical protein